jgi:hypothetical protein
MNARVEVMPRVLASVLVVALLASCTSYRRALKVDDLPGALREGDRLSITLKDGQTAELTVAGVTGDAIRGRGGETVAIADIETIQVTEVDTREITRKGLLAVGIVLVVSFWVGFLLLTQIEQVGVP